MHSAGRSQSEQILRHLREVGPLTPLDALNLFGCFRLGARIYDLKAEGHDIQTELVHVNGKAFARYWLPRGQLDFFGQMKTPGGASLPGV